MAPLGRVHQCAGTQAFPRCRVWLTVASEFLRTILYETVNDLEDFWVPIPQPEPQSKVPCGPVVGAWPAHTALL